ncbi:MAG: NfeD family protein [Oscillospiraceae bacterium]|nr:NfeD family protein [Oscillospiraceae bacterium]
MNPALIVWIVLFVACIILESISMQLFSVWFALGALGAIIANLVHAEVWAQILVFTVVSAASLIATRPLVKRMQSKDKRHATNADRYLEQSALVIEEIDNAKATGQVQVLGSIWTARSIDGSKIPEGSTVRVAALEGVKLMVTAQAPPAPSATTGS